jgi:phosphoglycolate phosphatase-like HAD superfamily hydrolase
MEDGVPGTAAVLFDIDGTLMVRSSPHLAVIADTLSDRVGRRVTLVIEGERPHLDGRDISGWVDVQIVRDVLSGHLGRAPTRGEADDVMREYAARFRATLRPDDAGTPVAGIEPTLVRLRVMGIGLGLVTGNASEIARAKLEAVGLADYFSFDRDLGFGDWRDDRAASVEAAVVAACGAGPRASVMTVGDTTADVRAASAAGALGIGVLTGASTADELAAAGAWRVVPSASDVLGLVRAVR